MGNKISRRKQINILVATLFILVTPFCLYFFLYYSGQQDYFTNRNFRLLAVLGRGIEKKVDAIGTAYSMAVEKVARSYYKPDAKCQPRDPTELESLKMDSLGSVLDAHQLQTVTIASEPQNNAPPGLTLEIKREGGTRKLVFDYLGRPDSSCAPVGIHSQSNFDDFVSAFFNRFVNGKDFNSVFIADADGKLLYQWNPDELGLTDFNALTTRNQGKVDFDRFKQNGSVADVVVAETDYKFFAQPIDLSLAKTSSPDRQPIKWVAGALVRTSQLNSQSRAISYNVLIVFTFLLILVVLSFPFLKLVFMRAKDVMGVADMYFLAFSTLVGTAVLTAFLVYGLIYIGLRYQMDNQLRLLSDQIVKNFEAEVGSACEQLVKLNQDSSLLKELDVSQQADKDEKAHPAGTESSHDAKLEQDELKDACRDAKDANGQTVRKRCFGRNSMLGDSSLDVYPYLTTAAWVDSSGQQRIKWTTKPTTPLLLSVTDRAYFQDIRAKRAWNYNWNQKQYKYYLEPVYSKATGIQQVILSMPAQENSALAKEGWVSTLDLAAVSLVQVVLPRDLGYGYCVINNEGDVLFHSDDTRNQIENFLRESDNDAYLRSVILARESKTMDAQYLGVGHRLFVRSIPNTPWSLVTFRDEQIARAGCLEFIAYAIYLFCLYATVLLLFWGIYYILKREDRSSLLWPYEKRAVNYYLSIAVNLLLALVFALAIATLNRWLVVIVLVLLPAIGFLVHHYNLRADLADCGESLHNLIKKKPSLAPRLRGHNLREEFADFATKFKSFIETYTPLNYKSGYVLTLVSLLMLVSVLPMLAFFKFAYDREMRLFVGLGQINIARGLEERAGSIQTQYLSSFDREPPSVLNLVRRRLDLTDVNKSPGAQYSDVYADFFFNSSFDVRAESEPSQQASPANDSFDATFEWIVPFENSLSLTVRGLTRSMAGNNAAMLLRPKANPHRQILQTEETVDGIPEHTILRVESDSAPLGRGHGRLWWGGLILILLIIPAFLIWLITFVGRRIFLLNTDEPTVLYGSGIDQYPPSQNLLVLAASSLASKNAFLARQEFKAVDLRGMNDHRWREFEKQLDDAEIKTIAINYFEDELADARHNLQKAKLVEYLLARNKRVIVASTVDLAAYNFGATASAPGEQGVDQNSDGPDRNLAVFNLLRRFYLEDTISDAKGFVKQIEEYEAKLDIDKLSPRQRQRVKRVLKTLTRECKSRAYLQQIGRSLLRIDDPANAPASDKSGNSTSSDNSMSLCELKKLNTEIIYSRVQERCNAYYYALWETCSREEKLTLVHLATHRLISSRNPSLRRLLRSALVSREPFLRPMNETFSRFVSAQATEFNLKAWKGKEESGIWEDLKVPFAIILLVAGGFLFVSQRDLYNSTLAFVSAFAAAMPALFKVLGMFPGSKPGGA